MSLFHENIYHVASICCLQYIMVKGLLNICVAGKDMYNFTFYFHYT